MPRRCQEEIDHDKIKSRLQRAGTIAVRAVNISPDDTASCDPARSETVRQLCQPSGTARSRNSKAALNTGAHLHINTRW